MGNSKRKSRWKRTLQGLMVLCISLFLCFLVIEMSFHVFAPQVLFDACNKHHPDFSRPMTISDELLGWRNKPYGSWCLYQPDTHEKIQVTTNSKGLRGDKEFPYTKPPNTFRILVFGDSFVWGENLHHNQTFAVQLKQEIEKKRVIADERSIEVIPFGVGSYSTHQTFLNYLTEGLQYEADLVMYLFYQNDFTDHMTSDTRRYPEPFISFNQESQNDHGDTGNATRTFSYVVYSADTLAKIKRNETKNPYYFEMYNNDYDKIVVEPPIFTRLALESSHFAAFIHHLLLRNQRKKSMNFEIIRLIHKFSFSDQFFFNLRIKYDDTFKRIITNAHFILKLFNEEAQSHGTPFLLVNVPSVYQVKEQYKKDLLKGIQEIPSERYVSEMKHFDASGSLSPSNYLLTTISQHENILYSDLTTVAQANSKRFFHQTDNHWSPYGVAVSAQHLATELKKQGLLPKSHAKI